MEVVGPTGVRSTLPYYAAWSGVSPPKLYTPQSSSRGMPKPGAATQRKSPRSQTAVNWGQLPERRLSEKSHSPGRRGGGEGRGPVRRVSEDMVREEEESLVSELGRVPENLLWSSVI